MSHTAVQKAIRNGRLAEAYGPDKKLDLALAEKLWVGNQDLAAVRGGDVAGSKRPKKRARSKKTAITSAPNETPAEPAEHPDTQPQPVEDSAAAAAAAMFSRARADKEVHLAQRAKLAYEREAGQLISKAENARDWFEACRQMRDALFAIPDRIASQLAAELNCETVVVYEVLVKEIRLASAGISESFRRESENGS